MNKVSSDLNVNGNTPLASVVILTKNGASLLKQSIEMIFAQQPDFAYEVIAVDSGSTDGTLQFLSTCPIRVFRIKPEEFRFGRTRDFAFAQARGKYIVTISQDVIPRGKDWLANFISPLVNNQADLVQGYLIPPKDREVFFWERNGWFYFTSEKIRFNKNYGGVSVSSTDFAIKRAVWEKIRFADVPQGEEKVLQRKLCINGYKIVRRKDVVSYHGHMYNLKSLIKRCRNEGLAWQCAGERYTFLQMLKDLVPKKWMYRELFRALVSRKIRNIAEILFPVIRPIYLYQGNLNGKVFKT